MLQAKGALLVLILTSVAADQLENVFVEQPASVVAPLGTRVQLNCSVSEGYGLVWEITLANGSALSTGSSLYGEPLRLLGIGTSGSSSNTNSFLFINGSERNSKATITCRAFQITTVLSQCTSMESRVIFYGPPSIPSDLTATGSGLGSLNISWSLTILEGMPVEFTLTATNLNDSDAGPIIEMGIAEPYWVLTIEDSMPCDVYSFQVTARNDAGSSGPSDSISKAFPSLPDLEDSLEHTLSKMDGGITLNVTLNDVTPCPEYPVHSYTLVVVDSVGNRTARTSRATGDTVNIAISGLRENSRFSYHVLATNQFGNTTSTPMEIVTTDVQSISICQVESNAYMIQCHFLNGSDASGCVYVLVSGQEGVEDVRGAIERSNSTTIAEVPDISVFNELLAFDLEADKGDLNVTTPVANIAPCPFHTASGGAALSAGVITALALLLVLILLVVLTASLMVYKRDCIKRAAHKIKRPLLFSKRGSSGSYTVNQEFPNFPPKVEVKDAKGSGQYDIVFMSPVSQGAPVLQYDPAGYACLDQDSSYETAIHKQADVKPVIEPDPEAPPILIYSPTVETKRNASTRSNSSRSGGDYPAKKTEMALDYAQVIKPKSLKNKPPVSYIQNSHSHVHAINKYT